MTKFYSETDLTIHEIKDQLDRIEKIITIAAKQMLTVEDVVLLTGLSKSYLYKMTSANTIPHYKPNGKNIYFDKEEVMNWMKQNRIATIDEIEQKANNYISKNKR